MRRSSLRDDELIYMLKITIKIKDNFEEIYLTSYQKESLEYVVKKVYGTREFEVIKAQQISQTKKYVERE